MMSSKYWKNEKFSSSNQLTIGVFLVLYFLLALLIPKSGHPSDFNCWTDWTSAIFTKDLGNIYSHGTNYLPLYQYFLMLFGNFQGSVSNIHSNINSLKYMNLIFDVVGVYFVFLLINEKLKDTKTSILLSLLILFNIAYLYNTMIWGQVDAIFTTFLFIAFYFSLHNKILLTILFCLLSINMKLQAIIFFPFIGLILLPSLLRKFNIKSLFTWIVVPIILQFLILLPFYLQGDLEKVVAVVTNSVGTFPKVSLNAYNMWYWFIDDQPMGVLDTNKYCGLSYYQWGFYSFIIAYTATLFPLLQNRVRLLMKKQEVDLSLNKLLLIATLIPIVFFFFNTQMHERYSHPMLIFAGTYAILNKKYLVYILLSISYFLNLELVLDYFNIESYNLLFLNPDFVAAIFMVAILLLFYSLYKREPNLGVRQKGN
ncbi:MAG: hypothetical protein IPO63_03345 [Bacteroidetes bacterium]|nr:hypothetical protein [Bacteroidota bacterium]